VEKGRTKAARAARGRGGHTHETPHSFINELKQLLGLRPLPVEGGYYAETYRSAEQFGAGGTDRGPRSLSTAIYYLLTRDTCSRLHRLTSDEVYHFYLGDPVDLLLLSPDGTGRVVTLGPNLLKGMTLQTVVPRGTWQGSWLRRGGRYALMGTTMAPGFDSADCELGDRARLVRRYAAWASHIVRLTPAPGRRS
jgi:hypothetical protein